MFSALAGELLEGLEAARPVGGATHPNALELEAQRALVRHAIHHGTRFKLQDDHWGRTGYVFVTLFEQGQATMDINGRNFRFSDVAKENWMEGTQPFASRGGFLYRDAGGVVLFRRRTWIS